MKIVRSLGREVNFVLQLLDDHSREPPIGPVRYIKATDTRGDVLLKPLMKQSGYAVFTNLEKENHMIRVETDYYMPLKVVVDEGVEPLSDIGCYRLKPTPAYPFNNRTTVAYFRVVTTEGDPFSGDLCAFIDDESRYVGRVMEIADDTYRIAKVNESLTVGDEFILSGDGNQRLRINRKIDEDIFEITMVSGPAPKVGDKLYKALFTQTGLDGRGVVYFTGLHQSQVSVKLLIDGPDQSKEILIELSERDKLNLGDIVT